VTAPTFQFLAIHVLDRLAAIIGISKFDEAKTARWPSQSSC
jgi:hypothetical protein